MLKPTVQVHTEQHALVAEFWDCLRLDPAPVKELRGKYEAHVRSKGRPMLVVDLIGVGFAGSAALGMFVTLLKMVRHSGGQVIFCNVEPTVAEVFRISKLAQMFLFVSDRPAVLAEAARLDTAITGDGPPPVEPAGPAPSGSGPSGSGSGPDRNSGSENLLRRHRRRNL